jgi:hypothetical protein
MNTHGRGGAEVGYGNEIHDRMRSSRSQIESLNSCPAELSDRTDQLTRPPPKLRNWTPAWPELFDITDFVYDKCQRIAGREGFSTIYGWYIGHALILFLNSAFRSYVEKEWMSTDWTSKDCTSKDCTSKDWTSKDWTSKDWTSNHWTSNDWMSKNWTSKDWT